MAIDEHLTEHARSAMIGLAIGDALGMPTQSMSVPPTKASTPDSAWR